MKKFTIGAVSGVSALALAFPLFASAQSAPSANDAARPVPSQVCVQALAAQESTMIANMDSMTAARKAAMQAHQTALSAAASITDDAQRQDALKKANEDMRAAMKTGMDANKETVKSGMDAVKTACGNGGFHLSFGMGGFRGPMHGKMMKHFGDRGVGSFFEEKVPDGDL